MRTVLVHTSLAIGGLVAAGAFWRSGDVVAGLIAFLIGLCAGGVLMARFAALGAAQTAFEAEQSRRPS